MSTDKNKSAVARALGISRSSLYYVSKKETEDWRLKTRIHETLREHHAYGSRRIADTLHLNRKRIQRVMRKFGIKPYRRRGRKWKKKPSVFTHYPNLLLANIPSYENHVWASDFTELKYDAHKIYVCTVLDIYTRKIMGVAVSIRKGAQLTLQALHNALLNNPRPKIFHSDNGREYDAKVFMVALMSFGILISRSHPGCPWENGYQESYYDKFKVELGDPSRFKTLGELVAEIYRTVWGYNNTRIHSALKMPPVIFARKMRQIAA